MIEPARIGLSKQRVTVLAASWRFARRRQLVGEHDVQEPAAPLQAAATSLRACGRRAHLVLADEWVRYFMVTPPAAARSLGDCQAAAALRFAQLHAAAPEGWEIRADWRADRPFLACALPTPLLDHLRRTAVEAKLRLLSAQPQFIAAFNAWRRLDNRNAWLAVHHDRRLTLGILHDRRLVAVRSLCLPDPAILADQIRREALRMRVPMPGRLRWLGDIRPATSGSLQLIDMRAGQPAAGSGLILAASGAA